MSASRNTIFFPKSNPFPTNNIYLLPSFSLIFFSLIWICSTKLWSVNQNLSGKTELMQWYLFVQLEMTTLCLSHLISPYPSLCMTLIPSPSPATPDCNLDPSLSSPMLWWEDTHTQDSGAVTSPSFMLSVPRCLPVDQHRWLSPRPCLTELVL